MESSERVTQILKQVSGALLDQSRFGRSDQTLFTLSGNQLVAAAKALKDAGFDILENLSAAQKGDELAFTYFIRSSQTGDQTVIRVMSKPVSSGDEWISHESVVSVWPMAAPFESEVSRLWGVQIEGCEPEKLWDGFPLRKSFVVTGGITP